MFMTVVCHFQKVLETLQMHMRVHESFLHLAINHNGLLFRFERDVVKSHGLLKTLRCVSDIAI